MRLLRNNGSHREVTRRVQPQDSGKEGKNNSFNGRTFGVQSLRPVLAAKNVYALLKGLCGGAAVATVNIVLYSLSVI